jgi:two-component system, NtrC family, sensor kinase
VDDREFLVHLVALHGVDDRPIGTAEIWRDLTYIDAYLRATKLRLLLLAVVIGALLTVTIVVLTRKSVTEPAARLVAAMEEVANGNLSIRVAGEGMTPEGEPVERARDVAELAQGLQLAREDLERGVVERNALASRLRQSERLATLGQVVAEVAHEIGTPLNVITGRAEYLAHVVKDNEPAMEIARLIAEQGRRITRIMQRLLHLARERMPQLEAVAVVKVARQTADFLAPDAAPAKVTIVVEGEEATSARADADLLQQVLINLLHNAVQASPSGGLVRLVVSEREGNVLIDVRDDGPGVAPEILPRLFEPFATTKPAGRGTGLGLSLSRSILRQMGGSLRYLEEEGRKGAHFQASLLSASPADEAGEAAFEARLPERAAVAAR